MTGVGPAIHERHDQDMTEPDQAMIDLYLVRHAHAGNPVKWAAADELRPLSARGLRQATRLGDFLASAEVGPVAIVTSPKVRARQTADVLGAALSGDVRLDERLADGLSIDLLRALVGETDVADGLMLVGHDPDFSEVASVLVGAPIVVRKGAVVRLALERDAVDAGAGILRWLIPPEALGR